MSSHRILPVEDSSTMRRMLSMMLQDEGFNVQTANDGVEGLAKAAEGPRPDLILTDYEMPELDGVGLCRAVKSDASLRSIPVLLLTALGSVDETELDVDGCIRKPKTPDDVREMFARIRAHLEGAGPQPGR